MNDVGISDLVRTLLAKRGVESEEDVAAFLSPDYDAHTHAPELLHDMKIAVDRILKAIENNERIAFYTDFDCDGIPGAAILSDFFAKIKYDNVEVYIPHRDREGYGFHVAAIEQLAARDVKVIITVDVGTVAREGCAAAHALGIDVIVTDHHEIIGERPACLALVNPKIAPYPFGGLCGAATAFKLVQATLAEGKRRGLESFTSIPDGWEKWLLDLVAIATVADMMPLVGENRTLVHWGLKVLRKSARPGIDALCAAARIRKSELTEDDIGFTIAPRVNAASRMDEPNLALKLLTTRDRDEAQYLAAQLEHLNASRKGVVAGIVKNARKHVAARYGEGDKVVVLGDTAWKPSLLGLAANSIMNDRGGIVCLWGRDAHGKLKGSCRSDGEISLVDLFTHARDVFEECGGHAASGGFSVSHEHVHTLPEALARTVSQIQSDMSADPKASNAPDHDSIITLREASWALFKDISLLSPFGISNTKPVFRISTVTIRSVRQFGKENNHVELQLIEERTNAAARAFQFFKTAEDFSHTPRVGDTVHVLATLERDTFRGETATCLRVIDILSA
ncbi:single-stranded-DNA-specific exonuclease RecJ [Candidatus Kaiserbacteria bacterium]|nr:single-stranded-DNA-specific exonuclease RecJ [Candidatus Kaiserbacteria bacterium]